jgi:hypothetical protein
MKLLPILSMLSYRYAYDEDLLIIRQISVWLFLLSSLKEMP